MEKDELFAKLTLDAQEFALYKQIHTSLKLEPPKPDLVIYLQAPTDVLLQRIQQRVLNLSCRSRLTIWLLCQKAIPSSSITMTTRHSSSSTPPKLILRTTTYILITC